MDPARISQAQVLDCDRRSRQLVLMLRESLGAERSALHRFVCGHDERDWFAAALPDSARVTTVSQALEALKPDGVRRSQRRHRVPTKALNRRHNAAFVRQGEWFFVPVPHFEPGQLPVLRHEAFTRGAGKPHVAERLVRRGGRTVYRCFWSPLVLPEREYLDFLRAHPDARSWGWRAWRRDMKNYVWGRVTHPDHRTVVLDGWHRVEMNTEDRTAAGRQLLFLD